MATTQHLAFRQFVRGASVFGHCFSVSLLCALFALPVLHYFGGPAQLAGTPIFSQLSAPRVELSEEAMLGLRLASVVLTLAFFYFFARFGISTYRKAFGVHPNLRRMALVSGSLLVFAFIVGFFFLVLLKMLQPDLYSKALFEYTTITLWPFALVPIGAGWLSGMRSFRDQKLKPLPPEIERAFGTLQDALDSLPRYLSRAVNVTDPLMDGNVSTAALAALSASSIVTAGLSSSPSTFALLFALPIALTLGNGVAYFVLGDRYKTVFPYDSSDKTSRMRFVLLSVLLVPGLVVVSIFCFVAASRIVNALSVPTAIPLELYYPNLLQNPQTGIAYAIALLGPAYWVGYFLCKQRQQTPVVEEVALVQGYAFDQDQ